MLNIPASLLKFYVDADSGCWVWHRSRNEKGYGTVAIGPSKAGKAHRVMYETLVAPIPAGRQLDHLCRNRACVNPSHLEPVTPSQNVQRGWDVRPRPTHCPQGHPYDEQNTYSNRNRRFCKQCNNDRSCRRRRGQ